MEGQGMTDMVTTSAYIAKSIEQYQLPDEAIDDLREKYGALTIKDTSDKEGYKTVKEAISHLTKLRTAIGKKHKELKALPLKIGRAIDGEKNRLTELIKDIEQPLKDLRQNIDDEKEREKREKFEKRMDALFETGAQFNGSFYRAGDFAIAPHEIEKLSDKDFEYKLEQAREAFKVEEARKKKKEEEQAKKDAELEKLRAKAAELEQPQEGITDPIVNGPLKEIGGGLCGKAYNVEPDTPLKTEHSGKPSAVSTFLSQKETPKPEGKPRLDGFQKGFFAATNAILKILNEEGKMTRAQLKERILSLTPNADGSIN